MSRDVNRPRWGTSTFPVAIGSEARQPNLQTGIKRPAFVRTGEAIAAYVVERARTAHPGRTRAKREKARQRDRVSMLRQVVAARQAVR